MITMVVKIEDMKIGMKIGDMTIEDIKQEGIGEEAGKILIEEEIIMFKKIEEPANFNKILICLNQRNYLKKKKKWLR